MPHVDVDRLQAAAQLSAEEMRAACEPPSFTVGGRTYVGVVPSAPQMAPYEARFARLDAGLLSDAEAEQLADDVARELFPPDPARPRRWWRRLLGRPAPPRVETADVFRAMPFEWQAACLENFSRSLSTRAPTEGRSAPGGAGAGGRA